jgi:hypothetical protein
MLKRKVAIASTTEEERMSTTRDEVEALEIDPRGRIAQWFARERAAYLKRVGDDATPEDFREYFVERVMADPIVCRIVVEETFALLLALAEIAEGGHEEAEMKEELDRKGALS